MASGRNPSLEGVDSEGPPIAESLVPTPIFSGQVQFNAPSAISFASATTELAAPVIQGTLMADFATEPRVLRDRDDTILIESFIDLVITWPGLEVEWNVPMANIIQGKDYISRAELARFVMDQFRLFASIVSVSPSSSPEWRLGEAADAYSTRNISLAFLWSPAPECFRDFLFRVQGSKV